MITNLSREDAAGVLQARLERFGVNFPTAEQDDYVERKLRSAEHSLSGEIFSLHARATVQAWPELGTFTIRTAERGGLTLTATELIAEVNDPECPFVGGLLKNRHAEDLGLTGYDSEPDITQTLAEHGVTVNEDGIASGEVV